MTVFAASSMPDRDWWAALWPHPDEVLRAVGIRSGMTVLDLCCGDGYFTAPLAKLVEGKVIALDIDCCMLDRAKAEVARLGATVKRWICADALALASNVTEPVDLVLIANTFHGVPDQPALAHAIRSVLRPHGLFVVINWYPAKRTDTPVLERPRGPPAEMRMSPQSVAAMVEPAGFRTMKLVALPPYHYGAVFEAARGQALLNRRFVTRTTFANW
jgi:SAM-dependent methyltransferase